MPALLIDASIYIFRYFFALPDHWFSQKDNWPTAAVYGYTTFMVKLLQAERPARIAACFDESLTSCFRNQIYPDYKCSRALPDEALAFQLSACRTVTELLGVRCYGSDTYEADDLLASLYRQLLRSPTPIAVLTRDKDLGQLLQRPQDFLWDYVTQNRQATGKRAPLNPDEGTKYYQQDIYEKFGVLPSQLVDYLALVGDAVDDIPGVPGIGKQTAQQLLSHFESLEVIFDNLHQLSDLPIRGARKLAEKLVSYQQQIAIAQQLAQTVSDLKLITSVNELNRQTPDWEGLALFCQTMGFPRLYSSIDRLKDI